MNGTIRKDIPLALYYQLKEEIRRKILAKEWKAGSKIPTENEICKMFGVSRITVRKALDELQSEGYLVKKQGRGTYVQGGSIGQKLHKFYSFSEELKSIGIKEIAKLIEFSKIVPDAQAREALQLQPDEMVFLVKRVRYMDEQAYTIEQSFIPEKFVPELTGELIENNGLYKCLNLFGIYLDRATETFSAVNLSMEDASYLQAEPHDAAINLTRITYSGANVVELCRSVVRGDVFHYTVELK